MIWKFGGDPTSLGIELHSRNRPPSCETKRANLEADLVGVHAMRRREDVEGTTRDGVDDWSGTMGWTSVSDSGVRHTLRRAYVDGRRCEVEKFALVAWWTDGERRRQAVAGNRLGPQKTSSESVTCTAGVVAGPTTVPGDSESGLWLRFF